MLNITENTFRSIVENVKVGRLKQGPNAEIIFSNKAALKILGITKDQLLGKTSFDPDWNVIHEDGSPFLGSAHPVPTVIATQRGVYRPITKERVWLLVNAIPEFNPEGKLDHVICTFSNITEQKKIEAQLIQNQDRIELAMKSANMAWWEMDIATENLKFDLRMIEILGFKSENFTNHNDFKVLIHPDDLDHFNSAIDKHITGQIDRYEVEYRIKTNNGEYKWLYNLGTITKRNEFGAALCMGGVVMDITERKVSEKTIKETNRRFRTLFEDSPFGVALVDLLTGNICDVNPMFAKITGRSIVELINSTWMSITHPDDIQADFEYKELLVNGKIDSFQVEKRYILPNGSLVWVNMTISHMISEENIPLYHLCMIEDITQQKQTIEKLNILSQIVEQSPSSILLTNKEGNIVYANKKFTEISGYDLNEVLGKNSKILKSGYTTPEEYNTLWKTIQAGNTWAGEFHNKKKNGDLYWEAAKISAVKNEKGDITHFMAIKEDITERKIIDKKLQKIAWHQNHQIRGPLTTIMGIIAAMNFKITLEEKLTLLGKLDEAAQKLDTAVRTIVGETTYPKL